MKHSRVWLVFNNKTNRCLKTLYSSDGAFFYSRKLKHKGVITTIIELDTEKNCIVKATNFATKVEEV